MGLDSAQDDGEWEVISKTSKNRSGSSSVKPGGSQDTHTKASRNPDVIQKLGMRNSDEDEVKKESDEDEDDDALDDTDDELLSEDFDSDTSQQSFETRKKSRWFKKFFDSLSVEDINEPARQWHCPACQGGPGAINWRGSSVVPAGEAFGKWKGLKDEEKDHEIVWPPMVIVMNTRLEQDGNDKWLGMGNQELLNYFRGYAAVKAEALLWQMTEDNQQLIYLENKVVKEQRHSKQLEEISRILNEKVRKTEEENYIVRRRTQMHHEQNKEELDFQEQFFKEQLETIHEQRGVKEEDFEKLQQDKRHLVKELNANPCNTEDYRSRVEEVEKFIELQDTEMGEYVGERDGLIEEHAEKLSAVKRRQHEEEVEIEKEFDARLASLMKKYTPNQSQGTSNA
ncbi:PROTEIN SUPPRESSOR OF GENE SILENCING 3 [Salix viminalis]|uniref:PROTEIN SUPPRESSOR OF GENE SILENCING 3 n=1 Tax=Salix viminalis TaxID=40686 RepID=A0A9Q0QJ46_SALVM|nr:PROTEIN SUPPRESSOR OF GENE SILENCING 3 [Salix viminalis]